MPHTHEEIFAAMHEADAAVNALATFAEETRNVALIKCLKPISIALLMACQRIAELEVAMKHKGLWN
jgi:hypothetical protein